MQFLSADLFKDFPTLRMIIPHGGGAVPYHWGRYRGLAQDMKRPPLPDLIRNNVFFDTCVYHQAGINPAQDCSPDNILFGSKNGGRGAWYRPGDRSVLRRHQALRRLPRCPRRTSARFSRQCEEIYPDKQKLMT